MSSDIERVDQSIDRVNKSVKVEKGLRAKRSLLAQFSNVGLPPHGQIILESGFIEGKNEYLGGTQYSVILDRNGITRHELRIIAAPNMMDQDIASSIEISPEKYLDYLPLALDKIRETSS